MSLFPQIGAGSVAQFPLTRSQTWRSIMNQLESTEQIMLPDTAAGEIGWRRIHFYRPDGKPARMERRLVATGLAGGTVAVRERRERSAGNVARVVDQQYEPRNPSAYADSGFAGILRSVFQRVPAQRHGGQCDPAARRDERDSGRRSGVAAGVCKRRRRQRGSASEFFDFRRGSADDRRMGIAGGSSALSFALQANHRAPRDLPRDIFRERRTQHREYQPRSLVV